MPPTIPPKGSIQPGMFGYPTYDKIVRRLMDVPAGGMEITLGEAGEIALYSDIPVDVAYEKSARWVEDRTDFRLKGVIPRIWVRTNALKVGNWCGRLVIYIGRPELGIGFERETWTDKLGIDQGVMLVNWPIAAVQVTLATFTASGVYGAATSSVRWAEAGYIRSIYFERTVGVIYRVGYTESETGATRILWEQPGNGTNIIQHYYDTPPRLVGPGALWAAGSNEAVVSTVSGHAIITTI